MPQKPRKPNYGGFNTVSRIAFGLLIPILVGFFLGTYLDNRFSTDPWLTIIFLMLGIIIGFAGLYKGLTS